MKKDIQHFAERMKASGINSDEMHASGRQGAKSPVFVVERLTRQDTQA